MLRWFAELGEPMPQDAPSISMNFTYQALEAALQGQGVMLAPLIYVRDRLQRGELVSPIPIRLATPYAYARVIPRIRHWVADESARAAGRRPWRRSPGPAQCRASSRHRGRRRA